MPRILTTKATITCPHGGTGVTTPTWPDASIQGGTVLREGDRGLLSCVFSTPCVGYTLRSMGLNATLVDGIAAILETDFNQSDTGVPLTMSDSHALDDRTRPGATPISADAPLSPAMSDLTPPTVVAAPPAGAFNSTTLVPPTLLITFTLGAEFPSRWNLVRLSEPMNSHEDLTNGLPPNAEVIPSGGDWSTPTLTVTLTLAATYMASLGVGTHHFYLTGSTQRGLSKYAEFVLTVN